MPYADPEKEQAYHRQYQKDHREEGRERSRRYKSRHRERVREASLLYKLTYPEKCLLSAAKERAKQFDWELSIDVSDIVITEMCPLLGIPLIRNTGGTGWNDNSPTLDRIDPNKGYVKENVWVISWRANTIKRNGVLEELEKILNTTKDVLSRGGIWYPSIPYVQRKKGEGRDPRSPILGNTKQHAKEAGIEFNLEHSDIVIPEVCPILGIPLFKAGGKPTPNSPSIDRIDPSKGYVKGNVWMISWHANRIKNNSTIPELELLVANFRHKMEEIANKAA